MTDAIEALARDRLIEMSLDLSVQLERGTGTRPMLYLLAEARNKAAVAMYALVHIDSDKAGEIRSLQNEVTLYGDMMDAASAMLIRGKEADREITEEDRDAISRLLTTAEAREAGLPAETED